MELNNIFRGAVRFSLPSLRGTITVPFPDNLTGPAVVKFKIPGACRPGEVHSGNHDPRILGIALSTMFLTLAEEAGQSSESPIVDENENPEDNSNVTNQDIWKMGEIFKSIKEQYNKRLLLLQTQHYSKLSSISVDLTQFRAAFDTHTMYTITLTDPEILKRYFHISSMMESYGKEQAHICYRNNSAWLDFIKKNEKEIIAETKTRKAFLEEFAKQKNVPTVQDENHVITQFLHKYQEYSRDQAKQIYRKFITNV